jgi:hypothetical protein
MTVSSMLLQPVVASACVAHRAWRRFASGPPYDVVL